VTDLDTPATVAEIREWLDDTDTNLDNEYDTWICDAVRAVLADNARLRALVADEHSRLSQELDNEAERGTATTEWALVGDGGSLWPGAEDWCRKLVAEKATHSLVKRTAYRSLWQPAE
jgi:hypothetical protein